MQEITKHFVSVLAACGAGGVFFGICKFFIIRYFKNIDEKLHVINDLTSAISELKAEVQVIKNQIENIKKDLY
jgi:hypothetical protein